MTATCQCLFAPKLDKKVFEVSIESNLNGNNWLCKPDNFQQCFNQEICFRKLCITHVKSKLCSTKIKLHYCKSALGPTITTFTYYHKGNKQDFI